MIYSAYKLFNVCMQIDCQVVREKNIMVLTINYFKCFNIWKRESENLIVRVKQGAICEPISDYRASRWVLLGAHLMTDDGA